MGDNLAAVPLPSNRTPLAIYSGGISRTCVLLSGGGLWCFGSGQAGALGTGDVANRGDAPNQLGDNLPEVSLGVNRTVISADAGDSFTCCLLDNGTVKCFGWGNLGRLGIGDQLDRGDGPGEMGDLLPPVNLGATAVAVKLGVGWHHTCAILNDGSIKCWGENYKGQLGQGDTALRGHRSADMGDALPPVLLGTGRRAVDCALGGYGTGSTHRGNTCVILDTGGLKCFGSAYAGGLGTGDTLDRGDQPNELGDQLPEVELGTNRTVVQVVAGGWRVCVILDDGSLKCFGVGRHGLGYGDTADRGDDPGEMGDNLPPVDLGTGRSAVQVSVSNWFHACVILDDGTLRCFGNNDYGNLGYARAQGAGARTRQRVRVCITRAPDTHPCAPRAGWAITGLGRIVAMLRGRWATICRW